jgi:hypothetical protein
VSVLTGKVLRNKDPPKNIKDPSEILETETGEMAPAE